MLKLDFHALSDEPVIGYGRAYRDIRYYLKQLLAERNDISLVEPYTGGDVQIFFGSTRDEHRERYRCKSDKYICYTMWETSKIPIEFVDNLNRFDEVIVPSEWNKQVFINSGVEKPISVIPLGINSNDWDYIERDFNSKPFTIIWQGSFYGDRKGGRMIEAIFNQLNLKDSLLILKSNHLHTEKRIKWDLWLNNGHTIRSIGNCYSQEHLLELLAQAHLSVYPSYGEGFGLVPLEHMATGLPVILSDNTGMSQYCDTDYCMPIECSEKFATYGEESGTDYLPDENLLSTAIEYAYHHRGDMKVLGEKASWYAHNMWSIKLTAERILRYAKLQVLV